MDTLNLSYWILQTLAMLLTCFLLPNLTVSGPIPAFLTVVVLAFINAKLWDAALFFQIPNHFSYQALTLFLANGIIFWIVVKILPGIEVKGVLSALAAPIVFTICSLLIDTYGKDIDWQKVINDGTEFVHDVREQVTPSESGSLIPQPTPRSSSLSLPWKK